MIVCRYGRPRHFDAALVTKARQVVTETQDLAQFRAAQAVLLPALADATLEQTATLLGVGRATVPRLQQRFRHSAHPSHPRTRWGGPAAGAAHAGPRAGLLGAVGAGRPGGGGIGGLPHPGGLARHLGRPVAASVVYRLLTRHGWRKVAPDTRHPEERPGGPSGLEKKLPEALAALLTPEAVCGRPVRVLFQDEARFGA